MRHLSFLDMGRERLPMRILFLHLSDLHLDTTDNLSEKHINEIGAALAPSSIGAVDKIFIFVTGDIGFSGKSDQYSSFNTF